MQLEVNKCSLAASLETPTFNECIWPHGNRTWHEPTPRPLIRFHR